MDEARQSLSPGPPEAAPAAGKLVKTHKVWLRCLESQQGGVKGSRTVVEDINASLVIVEKRGERGGITLT